MRRTLHSSIPATPAIGPGDLASIDTTDSDGAPEAVGAKLAQLKISNQKLQSKNLELRLRLQQRGSRWSFERQLLAIGGLGLLFMGVVVGLFLGLVARSLGYIG